MAERFGATWLASMCAASASVSLPPPRNPQASSMQQVRFLCHRSRPRLVWILVGWTATGCGDNAATRPPATPVRMLPQSASAPATVRHHDLSADGSFEDCYLFDPTERSRMTPLLPRLGLQTTHATLLQQPDRPLILWFETPPQQHVRVEATVRLGRQITGTDLPAPREQLVDLIEMGPLAAGETLAAVLERGTWADVDGRIVPLGQAARLRWSRLVARGGSQFEQEARGEELAQTVAGRTGSQPTLWAVILAAANRVLSISAIDITIRPYERSLQDGIQVQAALDAAQGVDLVLAKLDRDVRQAALIPAGSRLELKATAPSNTKSLTFGIGAADANDAVEPTPTRWRCEVTAATRVIANALGQCEPVDAHRGAFAEQDIALPRSLAAGTPVTVSWTNDGPLPLVVGQPIITVRADDDRRNLLLISIDTLRADHVGFHGYARPTTPFLDSLAARGVVLRNYRAVASYTVPTHASMFTGLFPPRHGTYRPEHRLDATEVPYLPRQLAEHGYVTAAFTGGGYVSEDFGFATGFDQFDTNDPVPITNGVLKRRMPQGKDRASLDDVYRWIDAHGDERWFAFVHTFAAHDYDPPAGVFAAFDTRPDTTLRDLDRVPGPNFWQKRSRPGDLPAGDLEHLTNLYDAAIRNVDDHLRDLFDGLHAAGLLDNTVVAITSDHGEELYDHQNIGHGISLYEEALRIPLLILAPGIEARVITDAVSQVDLMPTLLQLIGEAIPPGIDGRSRAALIRGAPTDGPATPGYAHLDTDRYHFTSLLHQSWKVIDGERDEARGSSVAVRELYDLSRDPRERDDQVHDRQRLQTTQDRLGALNELLRRSARDGSTADVSPEVRARLEELGYLR